MCLSFMPQRNGNKETLPIPIPGSINCLFPHALAVASIILLSHTRLCTQGKKMSFYRTQMVFGTDINKKMTNSSQENINDTSLGELNKLSTILACILESNDTQSEGHEPTGHLKSML